MRYRGSIPLFFILTSRSVPPASTRASSPYLESNEQASATVLALRISNSGNPRSIGLFLFDRKRRCGESRVPCQRTWGLDRLLPQLASVYFTLSRLGKLLHEFNVARDLIRR